MTGRADEPSQDVDLLVIGTGAAGMAAAIRGAELGARVAIVERGAIGGTCVNIGCIPSKSLIAAAHHYHKARRGFPGIASTRPEMDWRRVLGQKASLVEELRLTKYLDVLGSYPEITLLRGHARLLGRGRVAVDGLERSARRIVIAAGASPWVPSIPGVQRIGALDSTSAMDVAKLPGSLIVVGAGSVGLELGQMFARFGTRVTVVERLSRIVAGEDAEVSDVLCRHVEAAGIEIQTDVEVHGVGPTGRGVTLEARQHGRDFELGAERLLLAAGQRANTAELGLEAAGVDRDEQGFIRVDRSFRTTTAGIYAAGDVTGGPAFVYVAAAAGRIAAENALMGTVQVLDERAVPRVVFTDPQVAAVGLTEAGAREAGYEVETGRLELRHVARAATSRDARGLIKIVAEKGGGRVLGVHAVAPQAGELLGEAALAIRLGATVDDLAETLHPYLTWTEGLKLAAQTFTKDVSKLSCCG